MKNSPGTTPGFSVKAAVPHVMVVDDETTIRLGCVMSLRAEGFSVSGERNSIVALEKLIGDGGELYDAVVLDYAMPELGGLAFAQKVFDEKKKGRISPPIVMLSAYADGAVAFSAMKLGVWDFLNKPFMPEDVRTKVWALIKRPMLAQGADGYLARALLCCQNCEWQEALSHLAEYPEDGEQREKCLLMQGLVSQILNDHERARYAFEQANWWPEWHLQGPEIWPEIARRLM